MKSFAVFLLIVVIAAIVTAPGQQQFSKYLTSKGKNVGVCIGGTRHHSYTIFSIDYADYCGIATADTNYLGGKSGKVRTDKYVGLFGTFLKL